MTHMQRRLQKLLEEVLSDDEGTEDLFGEDSADECSRGNGLSKFGFIRFTTCRETAEEIFG